MERAKAFMQRRFLPMLQGKVHYQAEVVHFATDAESIGEVSSQGTRHRVSFIR